MLKMFSTQLTGVFKKLMDEESFSFEDSARLLAQAAIGDGTIYIHGTGEMKGILAEAFDGPEIFPHAKPYDTASGSPALTIEDRVLIFTRYANDPEALSLAETLREQHIPTAAVSSIMADIEQSLEKITDVHVDLRLKKGLLPDETGGRYGYPSLMAALFAYYGIKFTLEEILQEYE
ncbi:protein of unknown function [Bacillus sp. OV322]|uniref:DUF2529 domain-containing protein n=1 Tax=Bacillus sp. OV322 TaxID=1882764 RepID=UPI0008E0DE28|nr:DUF2529 domain-containing protein [Bacillus sp. OV322]SFC21222.1 protein of unknown function [Bacillus sp. OV322]